MSIPFSAAAMAAAVDSVLNLKPISMIASYLETSSPLISTIFLCSLVVAVAAAVHFLIRQLRRPGVYLLDYTCARPPDTWRISSAALLEHSALSGAPPGTVDFMEKVLRTSGVGESAALPPAFHYLPSRGGMEHSRSEAEAVFFPILDSLFSKSLCKPSEIGILIVNCCLFYPNPSLAAMIVNRYKLKEDIKSYNISGMGCAASVLCVDMAKQLLSVNRNTCALVLSSENMSGRMYIGHDRSMILSNLLFRTGGAAIILSNRASDIKRAKYKLLHTERTITAAEDRSYNCIMHEEDENGTIGVSLSKELMGVAADTIARNLTSLSRRVLPAMEILRYLISTAPWNKNQKPYQPDFKKAFNHFCIHAGGKAVIDEIEKSLRLRCEGSCKLTEASRMTLHRFGNTSSTSVWYELAYLEGKRKVKKGEVVWQVAVGSGFKCCSAVWQSRWNSSCVPSNPWRDSLQDYPLGILPANDGILL